MLSLCIIVCFPPHGTQVSPTITPNMRDYVHHMLVYLCPAPLDPADVGESTPCHNISDALSNCFSGLLIGAWAVGGEVSIIII